MFAWKDGAYGAFLLIIFGIVMKHVFSRMKNRKKQRIEKLQPKYTGTKRSDNSLLKGKLQCSNGNVYIGNFNKKNEFHGIGFYQYKTKSSRKLTNEQMEWRKQKLIQIWSEYRRSVDEKAAAQLDEFLSKEKLEDLFFSAEFVGYFGFFLNGASHGFGREITINDQAFEGNFEKGSRKGFGVNVYQTGICGIYVGKWRDDKRSDNNAWFYFGKNNIDEEGESMENCKYHGEFLHSKQHGTGVFYAADGSSEKQTYKHGKLIESEPN